MTSAVASSEGSAGGKYSDEKGGGRGDGGLEEADPGNCGGPVSSGSASQRSVEMRAECFSVTDEPSLESRATDNLKALLGSVSEMQVSRCSGSSINTIRKWKWARNTDCSDEKEAV